MLTYILTFVGMTLVVLTYIFLLRNDATHVGIKVRVLELFGFEVEVEFLPQRLPADFPPANTPESAAELTERDEQTTNPDDPVL